MVTYTGEIKLDCPLVSSEKKIFSYVEALTHCTLLEDGQTLKFNSPTLTNLKGPLKLLLANVRKMRKTANGIIYINIEGDDHILKNIGYIEIENNFFNIRIIIDPSIIIDEIITRNKQLKRENEQLRLEIEFAPEGIGAIQAKKHFESLTSQ